MPGDQLLRPHGVAGETLAHREIGGRNAGKSPATLKGIRTAGKSDAVFYERKR